MIVVSDHKARKKHTNMGNFKWNEFGSLKTFTDIEEYLTGRQWGHGNYFHYTDKNAALNILQKKEFWISSMHESNDTEDARQFDATSQRKNFALCFSCGISENLPLWYLYSGLDGKGARVRFTSGVVKQMIWQGEYWLAERVEGVREPVPIRKLNNDEFTVKFEDVVYYIEGDKPGIADLKYNTMTNHQMPLADVKKYLEDHQGFGKGLIWFYEKEDPMAEYAAIEKEARLLVTLNDGKEAAAIVDEDASLEEEKQKKYVVLLKFGEQALWNSMRKHTGIMFGPALGKKEMEEIVSGSEVLQELEPKEVKASRYAGTVKFHFKT